MTSPNSVLLVDDDADILEIETEILTSAGYSVLTAENGRVALDVLARCGEPCLVLLNVVMPEMSGPELLDVLRRSGKLETLPVVVVSATYAEPAGSHGEVRFFRKPILPDVLLSLVAEYCEPSAHEPVRELGFRDKPHRAAGTPRGGPIHTHARKGE